VALKDFYVASVHLGMSNKKVSVWQQRVTSAAGNAYIAAVTQTLKDATALGQLLLSVEDLSDGTLISKGCSLQTFDDAADFPASDAGIYAFDKFGTSYSAGFDNYHNTIPGRDMDVVAIGPDGITIIISGAGATTEVTQYVSRFNAVALGKNDGAAVISEMQVVS
jgi:hypothetical protein